MLFLRQFSNNAGFSISLFCVLTTGNNGRMLSLSYILYVSDVTNKNIFKLSAEL